MIAVLKRFIVMYIFIIVVLCVIGRANRTPNIAVISPISTDNFKQAKFQLVVPKQVSKPDYILVLVPGFNNSGDYYATHEVWNNFASNTNAVIIACTYISTDINDRKFIHYGAAKHGSGKALDVAIERISNSFPNLNLKNLPILIYGHSAGGQFAYGYSCYNPERLIGFVAVKGGAYKIEPEPRTFTVPAVIVSGQFDAIFRRKAIRHLFEFHRSKNAPWCWLEDYAGHEEAGCPSFAMKYFKSLLNLRLDKSKKSIKAFTVKDGLTVDLRTKSVLSNEIYNIREYQKISGFLPSKSVYNEWTQLDDGNERYF